MNVLCQLEAQKQTSERGKMKQKMSKAQMQMAIIKKKQCDAKALLIVEQLLEPIVEPWWLLQNLQYINRSHMEDVIEERAIVKLCGYVLCNKPLVVVINQQYRISTKTNKVYDITRRKNFCSSHCYGACNYLLEQMLTSPLWLRDKEEIPMFQLLPTNEDSSKNMFGDEIHVSGLENLVRKDIDNECESSTKKHEKDTISVDKTLKCKEDEKHLQTDICNKDIILDHLTSVKDESIKNVEEPENNIIHRDTLLEEKESRSNVTIPNPSKKNVEKNKTEYDKSNEIYQKIYNLSPKKIQNSITSEYEKDDNDSKHQLSVTQVITDNNKDDVNSERNQNNGLKQDKKINQKKSIKTVKKTERQKETETKFCTLAMRIEQSIKEWVTEDTLCFLRGDSNERRQLMENMVQRERYEQLCKKLNKIQLEDEKEDRENLENSSLKPLPHYSALREEANKLEVKVRAFYEGKMVIDSPEKTSKTNNDNEFYPILPLIDVHAPKILRRKILLDKLHKIIPDLLRMLVGSIQNYAMIECIHNNSYNLIKALVDTFSLSASNIVFKTAEWTLVGLIIIRMLSIVDPKLKSLLTTKQASMYISMVLMSYKLDSNYLDRFIIETCNDPNIFEIK